MGGETIEGAVWRGRVAESRGGPGLPGTSTALALTAGEEIGAAMSNSFIHVTTDSLRAIKPGLEVYIHPGELGFISAPELGLMGLITIETAEMLVDLQWLEAARFGSGGSLASSSGLAPKEWSMDTSRHDWLHSRGPMYTIAVHAKTKVAFLEKMYHDWFEKYHWNLDIDKEPNPEDIFIEPIDEEGILQKNKSIILREECLAHWSFTHYDDTHPAKPKIQAPTPFPTFTGATLLNAIAKMVVSGQLKPKLAQIKHIYSSVHYKEKVKPLVPACWAADKGWIGPRGKPFTQVSSSQALMKEMWEAKSVTVWEEIEELCQQKFVKAMEMYEKLWTRGSKTCQEFQNAIESIPPDCVDIGDNPYWFYDFNPCQGSFACSSSVHKGQTTGENLLDFGNFMQDLFNTIFIPRFIECNQLSLGSKVATPVAEDSVTMNPSSVTTSTIENPPPPILGDSVTINPSSMMTSTIKNPPPPVEEAQVMQQSSRNSLHVHPIPSNDLDILGSNYHNSEDEFATFGGGSPQNAMLLPPNLLVIIVVIDKGFIGIRNPNTALLRNAFYTAISISSLPQPHMHFYMVVKSPPSDAALALSSPGVIDDDPKWYSQHLKCANSLASSNGACFRPHGLLWRRLLVIKSQVLTYMPDLLDVTKIKAFVKAWLSWWAICQPKWRIQKPNAGGFSPSSGKGDWSSLHIGRNNGSLLGS
ncbi:hypothetical protein BS47DRAFT_1360761 [Hydnum rufescens UP504]|uniref:Uncharacterized protein n=1 Tax=Hydnum rufescens UP504 TaxID=1448309 RepID=A0A9P6B1N4_9AGAM|nr:hypothetical protein BS47DRAFT_1360761 [Hydnum rufescens UP504]